MLRISIVRCFALVALLLAVSAPIGAAAYTIPTGSSFMDIDFGDDDGDGIPNYLDSFDDRTVEEEEDEPPVPTPNEEDPQTPQVPEPEVSQPAPDAVQAPVSQAPSQPTALQVSALPNTGVGADLGTGIGMSPFVLILIGAGLAASHLKWNHRAL